MKYRIPVFCLFVLSPLFIFSQGTFSYDIELEYANFTNGLAIDMDAVSGNYNNAIEYERVSGDDYATAPVAYKAGNSPTVEAVFQTNCPYEVFIRGKHVRPDATVLFFPAHAITPNGGELHYTLDQPLDNVTLFTFPDETVEFHDPFEIVWQFSLDNSPNDYDWVDIHTSANPLYVTRATPNFFQPSSNRRFHTYFRTGCEAANGLSDVDEIIAAIWTVFQSTNSFKRADDAGPLHYYGDWTDAEFYADDMIPVSNGNGNTSGNGQCSAHSMSFLNCLKIQGINQFNDYLWVNAKLTAFNQHLGLLVDNYASNGSGPFQHWTNNVPPSVPQGYSIEYVIIPKNGYNFTNSVFADNVHYSEIDDLSGAAGQNNDDPKSAFYNHQIVRLADAGGTQTFYDVPYGVTYTALDQMENNLFGYIYPAMALVDEISIDIDLDGSGTKESNALVAVWLIDTDPEGSELEPDYDNGF